MPHLSQKTALDQNALMVIQIPGHAHGHGEKGVRRFTDTLYIDKESMAAHQEGQILEDVRERNIGEGCHWHGGTGLWEVGGFIFFGEWLPRGSCGSYNKGRDCVQVSLSSRP